MFKKTQAEFTQPKEARLSKPDGVEDRDETLQGDDMNSGEPMHFLMECSDKPFKSGKEGQDIVHRQSDYSIVSKKSRNWDGEKGVAVMRWEVRDTPARHRTGERVSTKLVSLTCGDISRN